MALCLQGWEKESAVWVTLMSGGGDDFSDGVAGGAHAAGIEEGGAVGGVVEEAEFDEPAFIEFHDGQGFVLALLFGLGSAIFDAEGVGDEGGELFGARAVVFAAEEDFGASGATVEHIAMNRDHALAFVGAGDVVATGYRGGIDGIAAGADDGVAGGFEDVANLVDVDHGDGGFFDFVFADGDDVAGVVLAGFFVPVSVAGIEAYGEGHEAT